MIGPNNLILNITYDRIEPIEHLEFRRIVPPGCFDREVEMTNIIQTFKTSEAIGNNERTWLQMLLTPSEHLRGIETANSAESYENRMSFFIALKGGNEGSLPFGTATTLAAMTFAAPINIVDLYKSSEWSLVVGDFHHHLEFMFDTHCSSLRNTQKTS